MYYAQLITQREERKKWLVGLFFSSPNQSGNEIYSLRLFFNKNYQTIILKEYI